MYSSLTRISTPLGSRRHVWIPRILTTRLVSNSVQLQIVSITAKLILEKFTYYATLYIPVSGIFLSFKLGAVIVLVFKHGVKFKGKVKRGRIIYFFCTINISRQVYFGHMA